MLQKTVTVLLNHFDGQTQLKEAPVKVLGGQTLSNKQMSSYNDIPAFTIQFKTADPINKQI